MAKSDLVGIAAAMREARSILVTTHVHPDGDAIGSVLALAELARALGCASVQCVLHDPVPRLYRWLPGSETIRQPSEAPASVDLILLTDASHAERTGSVAPEFGAAAKIAVVDHHVEDPPESYLFFSDSTYGAAGEIVVDLFEAAGVPLTRDAAVCAYIAILTDTGGFRFSNTSARTHRAAAATIESGVDVATVSAHMLDAMTPSKFALLRGILNGLEFHAGGRIAYGMVSQADMAEAGALDEDFDGLINYARNVEGVELAILMRQTADGKWKASCRSTEAVSCSSLMRCFGGGGHERAAGATLDMPPEKVRERVLEAACAALGEAP
jgi:phosphoesterase RecJ-like protein